MAYGKIKADAIIYDNSGSDVETTIQSLATPDEGTAVKSTGESGTTKFLRVDGDGTCSWQVPPTVTVVDEDNMSSDSATSVPSQQSVKAYVDTADALKANLASPTFTGTVNAAALTLSGNLQVNGTTTTVASSTMTVTDKNIEIAKGAANDAAADGAGITIDSGDGDKTWNWVDATDAWTSSEHIHLGDGKKLLLGGASGTHDGLEIYHTGVDTIIADTGTGDLYIRGSDDIFIQNSGGTKTFITCNDGASVEIYHDSAKKIETTAAGVTVTGTVTDSKGDVRDIPVVAKSSAYTLVATDAGKAIYISSGGVTVPASVLSSGKAVTIMNDSGSDQTITQGSGFTLYNSADGSTGNRTLAGRGMATILFTGTTAGYISGAGLS